jgi:hypothetical protein
LLSDIILFFIICTRWRMGFNNTGRLIAIYGKIAAPPLGRAGGFASALPLL